MKLHITLAMTLLSGAFLGTASAATRTWSQPINGNFDGPGNQWNVVPGTGDVARFGNGSYASGSSFEVTLTQNIVNQYLRVSDGGPFEVTLNLAGYTYTATETAEASWSVIGRDASDDVALVLTGGGEFVGTGLVVGRVAASAGSLTLKGGASLSTSLDGRIGNGGSAVFNILEGGSYTSEGVSRMARNAGSSAEVKIDGAGSRWTAHKEIMMGGGAGSSATLLISNGGVLQTMTENTDGAVNLAQVAGATVTVTVTGEDSVLNGRQVSVGGSRNGEGGAASVTVSDQGLLKARTTLNLYSGGVINVTGGSVEAREFGSDGDRVTGTLNLTFGGADGDALINISNDVFLNDAKLNLALAPGTVFEAEEVIRLLEYGGTLSGTFDGFTEGQTVMVGGQQFLFSYQFEGLDSGRFVGLRAIPEPGGVAMAISGFAAVMGLYGYRSIKGRGGRAE